MLLYIILSSAVVLCSGQQKHAKFLGIFNIVQFPNNVCNASSSRSGICYTSQECSDRGGVASGKCAKGFGTCCVFTRTCDSGVGVIKLNNKVGYLENPKYPEEDNVATICMVQIEPINNQICQFRLDFEEFHLDGGSQRKQPCDRDSMQVNSGMGNQGVGHLCGENTGQHLYLPVQQGIGGANLRITTGSRDGTFTDGYKFRIKVTQIDCKEDRALVAPPGCSQYKTDPEGIVTSYNFDPKTKIQYPLNLDYAYCFKRPSNACEIKFELTPGIAAFSTAVGKVESRVYRDQNCGQDNGCGGMACVTTGNTADQVTGDYLIIPGGKHLSPPTNSANTPRKYLAEDIYCGTGVGYDDGGNIKDGTSAGEGVISRIVGPVVLRFHSDDVPGFAVGMTNNANDENKLDEIGFSLKYSYNTACTN